MTALTHRVRDTLRDEIASEHPSAAEAFRAAALLGGPAKGYIVETLKPIIPKAPPPPPVRHQATKGITIEIKPPAPPQQQAEGPGLFD